ncbi:MAG: Tfp pilus assembly protein FimT/FimU [Desulfococcaceae bacterium]
MKQKMHMIKSENKGFSLLELMVIVAIVGVLAGLAISYSTGTPRERLKAASREAVSMMMSAKVNAGKTGTAWYVEFDTDAGTFTLYDAEDKAQRTVELAKYNGVSFGSGHGADTGKKTYTKQNGETFDLSYDQGKDSIDDGVTVSNNRFVYGPDAKASTTSLGAVYLKVSNGDTMVVERVSATGMIKTRRNFGETWEE